MKKLENKILKKVFVLETKRTTVEIIMRVVSILVLIGVVVFIIADIVNTLVQQQTLDVLQLFQEDREIVQKYFSEIMSTLYIELPKFEIVLSIVLFLAIVLFVLLFIKNFVRIKNKILILKKYWLKH